jgi:hypothetical protein
MTRTPAELFAEIAKADLERREPMMRADMAQIPEDDRDDGIRFLQGVGNVLAFVLCVAALVGLYLVLPS